MVITQTSSGNISDAQFWTVFGTYIFIFVAIWLIGVIYNLVMLGDAIIRKKENYRNGSKGMWILLLIFALFTGFSILISTIYFILVMRKVKVDIPNIPYINEKPKNSQGTEQEGQTPEKNDL